MPPKEKVSKARIEDTAFEMTREYGFSEVTARKLADRLGCSTQPIFRSYENMDELRTDLFYMSIEFFLGKMLAARNRNPAYMGLALSYVEFAKSEKNLFELIASVDDFGTQTVGEFLKSNEGAKILGKITGDTKGTVYDVLDVRSRHGHFDRGKPRTAFRQGSKELHHQSI